MGNANLHATMSPEDKIKLVDWCAEQGVSTTGFISAVVVSLDDIPEDVLEGIVKVGRKIDGQRRRRGPKPSTKVEAPPVYVHVEDGDPEGGE